MSVVCGWLLKLNNSNFISSEEESLNTIHQPLGSVTDNTQLTTDIERLPGKVQALKINWVIGNNLRRTVLIFQEFATGSDRACNKMAIAGVKKFGAKLRARILAMDTTGVEVTSGWRIDRAGNVAL